MHKELLVRVYRVVVLALLGYIVINMNWVSGGRSCDSNITIDESWSWGNAR